MDFFNPLIFCKTHSYMRKLYLLAVLLTAFSQIASAQMPNDGLMMSKRQWCTLLQYSNSSWENYWEGTKKRSNLNLGTFTSQNVMLMTNYASLTNSTS